MFLRYAHFNFYVLVKLAEYNIHTEARQTIFVRFTRAAAATILRLNHDCNNSTWPSAIIVHTSFESAIDCCSTVYPVQFICISLLAATWSALVRPLFVSFTQPAPPKRHCIVYQRNPLHCIAMHNAMQCIVYHCNTLHMYKHLTCGTALAHHSDILP